ncbi:MAG: glycosyltransferase family A protein [Candidatus Bathyarchaeia archaeon]
MNISVVIRTRDKERYFDSLLESLASQTVQASELVVVDNFSSEEKRRSLKSDLSETVRSGFWKGKVSVKLIALSDDEFSHAYSTNVGVAAAENQLVCITNAHSLPSSRCWLQEGTKHFEDRNVAGVSGFFIPHREGTAIRGFDKAVYQFTQRAILRQDWCSTINCIIRKSLWRVYPFDENLPKIIPETKKYGLEDYDWSKEMLARGFRIIVDPMFSVFHSHGRVLSETARNLKGYFVYRQIQQKIDLLNRPRVSFSRLSQADPSEFAIELLS